MVLDYLEKQETDPAVDWEVIVVDNNSVDSTQEVISEYQNEWPLDAPLKYAFESDQGKSYAIETAFELAEGELVAFLDDDNLPAPDWVQQVYEFGQRHPAAGAFGGQIHGKFEKEPSVHFGLVKPLFALNENSEEKCYSCGKRLELGAPGAGLVIRKKAWFESIPEAGLQNKGTVGSSRGQVAEDFEMQIYIYKNGWELWHNPKMHIEHMIPESRFDEDYLKKFLRAIGLSRYFTRMMLLKPWKKPFAIVGYFLKDLLTLLQLLWKYRNEMSEDKFIRGRILVTYYMLISPFKAKQ